MHAAVLPVLLAVCVVIIVLLLWSRCADSAAYLYGFWVADEEFCARAGIDYMMLFIGPATGVWSQTRLCHLVVSEVANQALVLRYTPHLTCTARQVIAAAAESELWPGDVQLHVDLIAGTLDITAQGEYLARLHKQHDTTNLCLGLEQVEITGDPERVPDI